MAQIVEFVSYKRAITKRTTESERWKAMAKGQIEYYRCEDCGYDIEVINNKFPTNCPCCNSEILDWSE